MAVAQQAPAAPARRADGAPGPAPPGGGHGAAGRPQRARGPDDPRRAPRPGPGGALLPAALVLDGGRLVADGAPDEVLAPERVLATLRRGRRRVDGWGASPAFDRSARTRVSFAAMPARARLGLLSLLVLVAAACGTSAAPTQAVITGPRDARPRDRVADRRPGHGRRRPGRPPRRRAPPGPPGRRSRRRPRRTPTCAPAAPTNKDFFAAAARRSSGPSTAPSCRPAWYVDDTGSVPGGYLTITLQGPGGVSLELEGRRLLHRQRQRLPAQGQGARAHPVRRPDGDAVHA